MTRTTFDVLVDVDDVLFPFSTRAHAICERAGITNGKVITQWNMHLDYGITSEALWAVLGAATVSGELYDAPAIPGALRQLRRLRSHGHRVHVATARGFGEHGELVQSITRDWLRSEGVPLDSVHFVKDKTVVPAHFAIDDGIHNYQALDEAGVMVWLHSQPHNQSFEGARRVSSVEEFVNNVLHVASVLV